MFSNRPGWFKRIESLPDQKLPDQKLPDQKLPDLKVACSKVVLRFTLTAMGSHLGLPLLFAKSQLA
jgi:hypothetical protein